MGTVAKDIREDECGDREDAVWVTEEMRDDGDSGFGED